VAVVVVTVVGGVDSVVEEEVIAVAEVDSVIVEAEVVVVVSILITRILYTVRNRRDF
jgi:hypothetical protein